MTSPHWQLQTPISAIVFDCDGTLSSIEGVNELARNKGVYDVIEAMTTEAMERSGLNPQLYQQRLQLIHPSEQQVHSLAQQYFAHRVEDVEAVISLLQRLNKMIYLVSAGVNPAVSLFGENLHIPPSHIYAVNLSFDAAGNYLDYDHQSPLIHNMGKRNIVAMLQSEHPDLVHIGDGLNDYVTHDIVTRFIGYGGVYYRKNMNERCQYYIKTFSLAPLLPLCLTQMESMQLTAEESTLYQKGMRAIHDQQVKTG